MGPDAMILVFWMLSFKPTFSIASWETCIRVKKQQLELDVEQQTGSK